MAKSETFSVRSPEPPDTSALADSLDLDSKTASELLALALEECEEPTMEGTPFGDYQILEELGRGASGVVYEAAHAGIHHRVAIKLMLNAELATRREIQRFREGAAAAADLDHPHIVPVFHVGERGGQPFFTMRLLEGGNLEQALPRFRQSKRAATLMAKVARAVHFAHERGVLHRDLKPANILLDEQDEPHVADFGLAKRLDERSVASTTSAIAGTTGYMAPEQLKLTERLTAAADIYGLGAILYQLLTGKKPPPKGSEYEQWLWLTGDLPVQPPRELDASIDQNVERICLRCLQKSAKKRYRSALEVATALERAVGGGREPPPPITQRLETWARRHPRRALLFGSAVVISVVASLSGWWLWQTEQRARRDTLETNAFIAGSQAGAAVAQLREYAERISLTARDPALVRLLNDGPIADPTAAIGAHGSGFDTVALLSNAGYILAEWPAADRVAYERSFAFRDYFQGARYLAEHRLPGAYVARAFRSETKNRLVFAFSAPVLDVQGTAVGVLTGTLNAKSVFGTMQMEDSTGDRHITSALIGPRGPDRNTAALPPNSDFTFLVHPGLPEGQEHAVARPFSTKLQATFGASAPPGKQFALRYVPPVKMSDYRDAVPGFSGSWLAAFAPVGNTGFVVLVQTRRDGWFD
jgi:hypothetical protein